MIRNFAVIGEAARHVPREIQAGYPEVAWARVRGVCSLVVRGRRVV